jgi:hypothetical protein
MREHPNQATPTRVFLLYARADNGGRVKRLHLDDTHLHRARLVFRQKSYLRKSPHADQAPAEKLINDYGYHRRDEGLADDKKAILGT